jgi:hypothetical protein
MSWPNACESVRSRTRKATSCCASSAAARVRWCDGEEPRSCCGLVRAWTWPRSPRSPSPPRTECGRCCTTSTRMASTRLFRSAPVAIRRRSPCPSVRTSRRSPSPVPRTPPTVLDLEPAPRREPARRTGPQRCPRSGAGASSHPDAFVTLEEPLRPLPDRAEVVEVDRFQSFETSEAQGVRKRCLVGSDVDGLLARKVSGDRQLIRGSSRSRPPRDPVVRAGRRRRWPRSDGAVPRRNQGRRSAAGGSADRLQRGGAGPRTRPR